MSIAFLLKMEQSLILLPTKIKSDQTSIPQQDLPLSIFPGEIQTFIVSSREGPGELVILREDEKEGGLSETPLSIDYHSPTVELLSKVLAGKAPEGYGVRDVSEMDLRGVLDPLRSTALKAFEGPFETLFLFEISNRSRRPVSIDKNTLKREGDLWVFVPKETLLPGETLSCIIATQKES